MGVLLHGHGETIDDALAAVSFLKKAGHVDPERIFVLGHSLGGMLVPRLAAAGKGLGIAGFVVMAGLARPLEDTILRQMTYLYGLDGSLSSEDRTQLDELRAQIAKVKAFTDTDAASGERILNAPARYWLDLRGYDPPAVAATLDARMLILQGARDYQVTTDDLENWKKALAGRPGVEFKLYPKLNHLFIEGRGFPTPDEYTRVHGNVAEEVLTDIAASPSADEDRPAAGLPVALALRRGHVPVVRVPMSPRLRRGGWRCGSRSRSSS